MNGMRFLIVLELILVSTWANGQYFPSEHWHEGYLVTVDSDTLSGLLKYDLENDLVQIERNGRIQTYSSRKMTFFEIFDGVTENYRKFYSIAYSVNIDYKVPRIFEMLYLGELTLLARESIVQEAASPRPYQVYGRRLKHRFFFVDTESNITLFTNKRSELLDLMAPKSNEMKSYIKKNNLRVDRVPELVRITAFYNSI